jgi:hypothetical protein
MGPINWHIDEIAWGGLGAAPRLEATGQCFGSTTATGSNSDDSEKNESAFH